MSDFMCKNNHIMAPSDPQCPECGGLAFSEDGVFYEDDIVDEYDPIDDEIIVSNFKGFNHD